MTGIDPVEAYTRAAAAFGGVVTGLTDDEWAADTWPEGWNVIKTVAWVVVGDAHLPLAVSGSKLEPPREFDAGVLGANPTATWRGTALAAVTALRTPGALERSVAVGDGEMVVADLVGQRVSENLVRAHDIEWAVGRADDLDSEFLNELADWCLDFWAGHSDALLTGEILPAEPVEPAPDADPLTRLLALTGRSR